MENTVRESQTTEIWCDDAGTIRHLALVERSGAPLEVYLDGRLVTLKPVEDTGSFSAPVLHALGSAFANLLNPDRRAAGWHTGTVRFHLDHAGQVDQIDEVKVVTMGD